MNPIEIEEWKNILKNHQVLFVGIITPLEILEKREQERKNRQLGSARSQYFKVHKNIRYNIEINTHTNSLTENVEKIIKELKRF